MRRFVVLVLLALGLATATPGEPARPPLTLVFLDDGGVIASEVRAGVEAAARYYDGIDRLRRHPVQTVVIDSRMEAEALREAIEKARPAAVIAAPQSSDVDAVSRLARRGKIPFFLTTPWEPPFSLDRSDPVIHVGGNGVDLAVEAAGYCRIPYAATTVAAIHDGTGPSRTLAEAFLRNRFHGIASAGAHVVPEDAADVAGLLMRLGTQKVSVVFVALDHEGALRVAKAAEDLDRRARWAAAERSSAPVDRHRMHVEPESTTPDRPRLLFSDGVLTAAMVKESPLTARFMVGSSPDLEDGPPTFYRSLRITQKQMPSPAGERGYAAAALAMEALGAARARVRGLLPALRELDYETMMGTRMLNEWGQTRFFTWHLWMPTGDSAILVKPTYLPDKTGGLLLRHRLSSSLRFEPDTRLIHLWWGEPDDQTIDEDLKRIGISTTGRVKELDDIIKDELLVRAAARLNRLFRRNADGTAIPGVSYRISFVTEIPTGYDEHFWGARIAGDHPSSGGLAGDPYSSVFSTFIVRTMYMKRKLIPRIRREDLDYFEGRYEWGTELERNLRNDTIRCLLEGLSGAFAMTTAHELGHIIGCSHDTASPRSIMNVAEGGGLEPDWAEWVPHHAKALKTRLGLEEPERRSRR